MKTTLLLSVLVFAGCVESIPEPTCPDSAPARDTWGSSATCGAPSLSIDALTALCCDGGEFFLPLCATRHDGVPYRFAAQCTGPDAEPTCDGSSVGIPEATGVAPTCYDVCPGFVSTGVCSDMR